LSRSWTTRARRPGEAEDAYTFVDRESFEREIAEGGFLEWATILGEYYGTPMPDQLDGRDLVLEIDIQGARQVKQRRPDAVCVLVLAPSPEAQEQRLRGRGDSEEHVARRVALGREEEAEGRRLASHIICNDDLEEAVGELAGIVEELRRRDTTSS
jgi:guanylate kinase